MPVSFGFWTLRGPTETAILPTENLTDARVRGLKPEHGEITDIKSGVLVRATQAGVVSFFSAIAQATRAGASSSDATPPSASLMPARLRANSRSGS